MDVEKVTTREKDGVTHTHPAAVSTLIHTHANEMLI